MTDHFSNIKKLEEKLRLNTPKYNFNRHLDLDYIETNERALGFKLSKSYKHFIERFNGGMILEEPESYYIDMLEDEPDGPKLSSFYFYTFDEALEQYRELQLDDWFVVGSKGIYPIIPICRRPDGGFLFMISVKGLQNESPVFASSENPADESCPQIASDFNTFLGMYIESNGFPSIQADNTKASCMDYLKENKVLKIARMELSYEEALEQADAKLKLDPDDAWAYCERGDAHLNNGYRKLALNDFNKAIEFDGDQSFFYYCRGDLILQYGSARKALIDLDTAVGLRPGDLLYLNGRARAFLKLGKIKKALADCNDVLNQDGINTLALMTRFNIYKAMGEDEKANADSALLDDLFR